MTNIEDLTEAIRKRVEQARQNIITRHLQAGQKASGRTMQSLRTEVTHDKFSIHAVLWGRDFFQGLETGRKGGKVPRGFYQMIKQWSIDKGIQFDKESQRSTFAYFVARKIAAEGTQLYRKGGRKDIYTPEVESAYSDIQDLVGERFTDVLMQSIKLNK